jgi:8-oxo-dGTP pyrophosphatase MutT (NUDIX family)
VTRGFAQRSAPTEPNVAMSDVWKPNVTVAAIVTGHGARAGRFLMVEEETRDGLRINQPAGHLEPGESIVDAVVRETLEETAHRFVPRGILGIYLSRSMKTRRDDPAEPVTYLRFAVVGDAGDEVAGLSLDEGIVRALWMSADEIRDCAARHRSPMVMRCLDDHLAGKPLGALELLYADPSALLSA